MRPRSIILALAHLIATILWVISEVEAHFVKPNSYLFFRKIYLHLMGVVFGSSLWVGKSLHLLQPRNIVLGNRCALGAFVRIENHSLVTIGDDFIAAPGLHINSGGHDPITMVPNCEPITIGNRVWCGVDVTILSGVNVGDDVVLAAGCVVCSNIPSNSIAGGVPAKVIKSLERDNQKLWTWVNKQ